MRPLHVQFLVWVSAAALAACSMGARDATADLLILGLDATGRDGGRLDYRRDSAIDVPGTTAFDARGAHLDDQVGPDAAAIPFVGGCNSDPNWDCTTPRNMYDYWPAPPIGLFIWNDLLQPDGQTCAKRTRYRAGNCGAGCGTSFMFDEYDCPTGSNVWYCTWYYRFDSSVSQVKEWKDDWVGGSATFLAGLEITWGGTSMTPGAFVEGQTKKLQDGQYVWGWAKTRLDGTYRTVTLNGITYDYAIHITNVQSQPGAPDINSGYILVPNSGSRNGHGGFIRQEYYDPSWKLAGYHEVRTTCVTSDFNQIGCP